MTTEVVGALGLSSEFYAGQMSRPFVYFFSVPKRKMDNSDENYVFALHFVTLTDVYLKKRF